MTVLVVCSFQEQSHTYLVAEHLLPDKNAAVGTAAEVVVTYERTHRHIGKEECLHRVYHKVHP